MEIGSRIFELLAIAISVVALCCLIYTDAYSDAARTEARGVAALTRFMVSDANI